MFKTKAPLNRSPSYEQGIERMAAEQRKRLENLARRAQAAAANATRRTAAVSASRTPAELSKNLKLAQTANKKAIIAAQNLVNAAGPQFTENWNRNALELRKLLLNIGRGHGIPGVSNATWLRSFKTNIIGYKKTGSGGIGPTLRINSYSRSNKPVNSKHANAKIRSLIARAWST